jgi:hypothetical protein
MRAVCHFPGTGWAEENLVRQVATRASLFMIGCVNQAVFAVSRGQVVLYRFHGQSGVSLTMTGPAAPVAERYEVIRDRQVPRARLRPHYRPT